MNINEHLPIEIKFGVIMYDANDLDRDGNASVLHFIGVAYEPTESEMEDMANEFIEDCPEYLDDAFDIKSQLAGEEVFKVYRDEYVKWVAAQN